MHRWLLALALLIMAALVLAADWQAFVWMRDNIPDLMHDSVHTGARSPHPA